jgi:magnesium transporter
MTYSFAVADPKVAELTAVLGASGPKQAAPALAAAEPMQASLALQQVSPAVAIAALGALAPERRVAVEGATPPERVEQWRVNSSYPEGSVGRLMEPPIAVFAPDTTIAEAIERLRDMVRRAFITYGYVADADGKLLGILVFRELLFAEPDAPLSTVMLPKPFALNPNTEIAEAMKQVAARHFPVYPATDENGRLVGIVRGQTLFQAQAFEISAQAGKLVGVEMGERLATPWPSSLKSRHPWLQLNLLTAFVAAAVVGVFEGTIDRIVILAAFLPVLAGQSGNTGCQALAVCLRAMTLGELEERAAARRVVTKEAILGACNGTLVGLSAGLGMFVYATIQKNPDALKLGGIVWLAMTLSCIVSGLSGAIIPQVLRRLGADPATASSIFLTTATDVVSMGLFLGLATLLIPG